MLVTAVLAGCSPAPTEQLPAAADLLSRSAAAMRTVQNATVDLQVDPALTAIPVRAANGTLTASGQVQGSATLDQGGGPVEFQFVIVEGKLYLKGPTGGFAPPVPASFAASLYDPAAILDPQRGVARLLATAKDASTEARETVDGVDTYRVRASFDQQAVAALVPGVTSAVSGLLWLDATTSRLVRAQVDVPGRSGGGTGPVTVRFSQYDAPVTITPPS